MTLTLDSIKDPCLHKLHYINYKQNVHTDKVDLFGQEMVSLMCYNVRLQQHYFPPVFVFHNHLLMAAQLVRPVGYCCLLWIKIWVPTATLLAYIEYVMLLIGWIALMRHLFTDI